MGAHSRRILRGRAWRVALVAAVVLSACRSLGVALASPGQILAYGRLLRIQSGRRWSIGLRGIGQAELPDVASGPPLSIAGLQKRLGLRLPLPERVALQLDGSIDAEILEANLCSAEGNTIVVDVLGALSDRAALSDGRIELQEAEAEGRWRVHISTLKTLSEGTLVSIYDITPSMEPPRAATGSDAMKNLRLQSSNSDPGSIAYNGMGGMSLEGCPRELDGVNFTFTVWSCNGAGGSCSLAEVGEDSTALVCEFGPTGIREGLKSMLPGESRRFWVPAEVRDRRFGRPPPDRFLPTGSLVVDMTLRSFERDAVFGYEMSEEATKLAKEVEERPQNILVRAIGVGVQFLPLAWFLFQQQQKDGGTLGPSL